ncbi:uncharacterized protein TrAFT101_010983 [Trichoderma asperellum]|uniref:uncharacterized protein n=1 Tax=Trichoderma asperellum TaxID=101201 RepID=UPI00332D3E01|nr:hypothetical protein TrAFT101_010983 [Trichoderma asperellum]
MQIAAEAAWPVPTLFFLLRTVDLDADDASGDGDAGDRAAWHRGKPDSAVGADSSPYNTLHL